MVRDGVVFAVVVIAVVGRPGRNDAAFEARDGWLAGHVGDSETIRVSSETPARTSPGISDAARSVAGKLSPSRRPSSTGCSPNIGVKSLLLQFLQLRIAPGEPRAVRDVHQTRSRRASASRLVAPSPTGFPSVNASSCLWQVPHEDLPFTDKGACRRTNTARVPPSGRSSGYPSGQAAAESLWAGSRNKRRPMADRRPARSPRRAVREIFRARRVLYFCSRTN